MELWCGLGQSDRAKPEAKPEAKSEAKPEAKQAVEVQEK
jgi:hypothetical protein